MEQVFIAGARLVGEKHVSGELRVGSAGMPFTGINITSTPNKTAGRAINKRLSYRPRVGTIWGCMRNALRPLRNATGAKFLRPGEYRRRVGVFVSLRTGHHSASGASGLEYYGARRYTIV